MCPLLRVLRDGQSVVGGHLSSKPVQPHTTQPADGSDEAGVHHLVAEPDRLENLGTGVGGDRRDAHLGHDLEEALVERLHEVQACLLRCHRRGQAMVAIRHQGVHRSEGNVRADCRRPVSE